MGEPFAARLVGALDGFFAALILFLPALLAAVVIVGFGVVVAWLLRFVTRRVLVLARFDRYVDSLGGGQILGRADVRVLPSALAANAVFWLVLVSFIMAALAALHVAFVDQVIAGFFLYLPNLFAALLILFGGSLLASFLSRAALLSAVNAELPSPRAIALMVKFVIAILTFAMALEQLKIARSIVLAAFIISFGSVMLALALAFGLGGRGVVARLLEHEAAKRERDAESHEPSHL